MSVDVLGRLCELRKVQGGLRDECRVSIPEQVITFLIILAHHKKNCTLQVRFYRSGETISRYFNKVLSSVIRIQRLLFAKAVPIPDGCIDPRWKWFKGYLGALDGTYIDVTVPEKDKLRYRTRKGKISTNVLGICNRDMNFVYVLSGWEGSTSDLRILRDAISRRNNLKIPIEDTLLDEEHVLIGEDHGGNEDGDDDMIESVEGSTDWTVWRDNLANEMYNEWMNSRIN
ncbi:uncharacterized protein [Arachis hypogaea]|uniref:uncharacterized protein n=1 Tax=Arachis hypogaea TaxID=3818 RepID=UPI000DEC7BA1|nr:uncharacterized protein LOC112717286 [Arachis hypogaea]